MQLDRSLIRDANWMTPDRARAYRNVLLVVYALSILATIILSHNGLDFYDRPLGTDFISFWSASKVALSDGPAQAYDVATHWAAQRAAFGGAPLNYTAFFYPPVFLLICLPLGLLPYFWALACWLGVTGALCLRALAWLGRGQVLSVLAFPAVWTNVMHGQNGFLTTALFAGAVTCLETRPVHAGVLLGCLIYKPHFLLMVPVALIAGRRWVTAAAAAGTAVLLCALSAMVLGLDAWRGFLADSALARAAMEQDLVGNDKMQSLFAAIRLLGGGLSIAYAAQAALALGVASVLVRLGRAVPTGQGTGAALAAAALLTSPFLLVYDLMLLAIPLLWLLRRAGETGFRPWEKAVLMAAFILPLVSVEAASFLRLPLAPLGILAVFVLVVRRLRPAPSFAG